ncbi:MAG: LysM peptidoglycan-binding domain-containing protein [Lachnospiraceae bacterium]|nr:LysM peptidoglycan-binding domain-containing protein [Lachnospiraceae bacterium]
MIYCRLITHTIKEGDTLYLLARRYQTTVPAITLMNPGVNPYNLQIGTKLKICMGEESYRPEQPQMSERQLWEDMREVLSSQGMLEKMFIDSSNFSTENRDAVMQRLAQNPLDFTEILKMYYSDADSNAMKMMQTQWIAQLEEMTDAAKQMDRERMMELSEQMRENAQGMAEVLAESNPELDEEYLEQLLVKLANSAYEDVNLMMEQKYPQSLMVHEDAGRTRMELADYLTDGIIKNFYDKKM